jgi:hypothetical protein
MVVVMMIIIILLTIINIEFREESHLKRQLKYSELEGAVSQLMLAAFRAKLNSLLVFGLPSVKYTTMLVHRRFTQHFLLFPSDFGLTLGEELG